MMKFVKAIATRVPSQLYRYKSVFFAGAIAPLIPLLISPTPGWSQGNRCSPPNSGEFTLMVQTPNLNSQQFLFRILPDNRTAQVCQYRGEIVTHIRNFRNRQTAQSWSQYILESTGLTAFIVNPPVSTSVVQVPTAPVRESKDSIGTGFAILVNYQNNPEIATRVQSLIGTPVGWASFEGNPYLLASQTSNPQEATATLMSLRDRGFSVILVDARQVRLLTPTQR
ncbi:hypothetical protein [Roseofilum casamattae]|uniref:SPOR domain-containing protein n=1 Tax=Roseofilum casamattae BLCC-M143 TaxID=3022442 RepID=A0ABT7BXV3_9CYAN|nr:hypothetical protein [Roseofilum casamattae]MDJ1184000.1 hypothetical protein [Roseofilum casamattae BLCC-M143]